MRSQIQMFFDATRRGDAAGILAILQADAMRPVDDRISEEDRGVALCHGARLGHLGVVRFLLDDNSGRVLDDQVGISRAHIAKARQLAFSNGDLLMRKFLMEYDITKPFLSGILRDDLFPDVSVRVAMDEASISNDDRYWADKYGSRLERAARHGDITSVRLILAGDAKSVAKGKLGISERARGEALISASMNKYSLCEVSVILQDDAVRVAAGQAGLSAEVRGRALLWVVRHDTLDILDFVLLNDAIRPVDDHISVDIRREIFQAFCRESASKLVRYSDPTVAAGPAAAVLRLVNDDLFSDNRISEFGRNWVISYILDRVRGGEEGPISFIDGAHTCVRHLLTGDRDAFQSQLVRALRFLYGLDEGVALTNEALCTVASLGDAFLMRLLVSGADGGFISPTSDLGRFIQGSTDRSMVESYREAGRLLVSGADLEDVFRVYLSAFRSRIETERPRYEATAACLQMTAAPKDMAVSGRQAAYSAVVGHGNMRHMLASFLGPTSDPDKLGGDNFYVKKGSLWQSDEHPAGAGAEDPVEYRGPGV